MIPLTDTRPLIIDGVLRYLYGLDYKSSAHEDLTTVQFHAEIFEAGAYFQLPGLQECAAANFKDALKDAAQPAGLRSTILFVYLKTSDSDTRLRDPLLRMINDKPYCLYDDHIQGDGEVVDLFGEVPQLASDILRMRSGGMKVGFDTADDDCSCWACGKSFASHFAESSCNDDVRCPSCTISNYLKYAKERFQPPQNKRREEI